MFRTAVVLSAAAVLAVAGQGESGRDRECSTMNAETQTAIRDFRTELQNRQEAAKKLLPLLTPGMNAGEVAAMLGPPGSMAWHYTLFYSSAMSVRLTADSKVLSVVSDVMSDVNLSKASGRDRRDPEIAAASSRFKAQRYSREDSAKTLIPFIKPGLRAEAVEELLGRADGRQWEYPLGTAGSSSLRVAFDAADKVTEAVIVPP